MKRTSKTAFLALASLCLYPLASEAQTFNRLGSTITEVAEEIEVQDSVPAIDSTMFIVRSVPEILYDLGPNPYFKTPINKVLGPWVFSGYRNVDHKKPEYTTPTWVPGIEVIDGNFVPVAEVIEGEETDTLPPVNALDLFNLKEPNPDYQILHDDVTPSWLREALTAYRIQEDFMYTQMVAHPKTIFAAYWDLPERPRLPEDDVSFAAFIKKLDLPDIDPDKAALPDQNLRRIHWLHRVNGSAQFSQAYVSKNWYQGGNNNLALLLNLVWNVQLNQVYHPNVMLQSNLQYKLGLNSTPADKAHDISLSEDVLQYNLNAGLKALKKWYYSFNMQFKTQIFNNYPPNSSKRKSSFLSPGDFNVGLGMSYSTQNKKKTFQLTATIAPFSYNLKTCIAPDDVINHGQFKIKPNRKALNQIGSNGEIVMNWDIAWNINYRTRLFLFTDYDYFLSDWENTISFSVNKFLSTQVYLHGRYDSSSDASTKWKHFSLREILSFGLTYTFSTKP